MRNNPAPVISGMIGQMILAIVIGSVYYNLEPTTASFDRKAILLYFGLLLNAFGPAFEACPLRLEYPLTHQLTLAIRSTASAPNVLSSRNRTATPYTTPLRTLSPPTCASSPTKSPPRSS
jgi:hypothetical protein